ncbi:hypothetical protein DT075_36515 [Bacillus licheniformis]|nr:hypothetical protein DT075_36515 [Bacillus licheniformis]
MFRVLKEGTPDKNGISPFQAFCISMAARVGTGNITGIAIAIALGGPGAIFWMWIYGNSMTGGMLLKHIAREWDLSIF